MGFCPTPGDRDVLTKSRPSPRSCRCEDPGKFSFLRGPHSAQGERDPGDGSSGAAAPPERSGYGPLCVGRGRFPATPLEADGDRSARPPRLRRPLPAASAAGLAPRGLRLQEVGLRDKRRSLARAGLRGAVRPRRGAGVDALGRGRWETAARSGDALAGSLAATDGRADGTEPSWLVLRGSGAPSAHSGRGRGGHRVENRLARSWKEAGVGRGGQSPRVGKAGGLSGGVSCLRPPKVNDART